MTCLKHIKALQFYLNWYSLRGYCAGGLLHGLTGIFSNLMYNLIKESAVANQIVGSRNCCIPHHKICKLNGRFHSGLLHTTSGRQLVALTAADDNAHEPSPGRHEQHKSSAMAASFVLEAWSVQSCRSTDQMTLPQHQENCTLCSITSLWIRL